MSRPELIIAGGAIRVFGDVGFQLPSRAAWNDPAGWRRHYQGIAVPDVVIAEGFLGDQYGVIDSLIVRWDPETGEPESTEMTPDDWIARVREDVSNQQPAWLLKEWEESNGPLPVTQHLVPKQPFVLGGEFVVDNLYAADAESDLAFRAQLARQLRDLPDGAEVRLNVRWEA